MSFDFDVFLLRQVLLEIAICLIGFSTGITLAFPSILNAALLAPDTEINVTSDQTSWIATCLGIGGLAGYTFIPAIFEFFGRKIANIVVNISIFIGSILLYTAKDVYTLAFSRIFQGPSVAGILIGGLTICECIPPKRRGYFMVFHKVAFALGSLACHALVLVLNWRQIALLGSLANFISLIILTFSAESPSYLANQGQFDKCAQTFLWYRGNSLNSKKELKELILAQAERLKLKEKQKGISGFQRIKVMLLTKDFQKSFYIVTLTTLCLDSCGRYFILAYVTQILLQLVNDKTLAMYISIVTDCFMIFALCISTVIVKRFKRRTLLFHLGFFSVFLMFVVSVSIILREKFNFLHDQIWITPTVIILQVFLTNLSLIPITYAIFGEVYSLEHKGLGSFLTGVVFLLFFNVVMKVTPILLDATGVEGTYFINGLFLLIFLILLRIVLPETKDKTLQQIENEIKETLGSTTDKELIKLREIIDET